MSSIYPEDPRERTRWILEKRPNWDERRQQLARNPPANWLLEEEPDAAQTPIAALTIFLTNRECPWRCLMCDLWQYTTLESLPMGSIPLQMDRVLNHSLPWPSSGMSRHLKLYNAGSFFDRRAISPADHSAIAERCRAFERVIVECHPSLIGDEVWRFRDRLGVGTALEVAMGLETANPEVLAKLNKGLDLEGFERAAELLRRNGVDLRVFVLVKPPFVSDLDAVTWAVRSVDWSFELGATVVSVIPTRFGNGAVEALMAAGEFSPPTIDLLEAAFEACLAVARGRGRVLADVWNLELFCSGQSDDITRRKARLHRVNLSQKWA